MLEWEEQSTAGGADSLLLPPIYKMRARVITRVVDGQHSGLSHALYLVKAGADWECCELHNVMEPPESLNSKSALPNHEVCQFLWWSITTTT